MIKIRYAILAVLIASVAFFFIGRATIEKKETVRYVKGETVTRAIKVPEVKFVEIPRAVYLPQKTITLTDSTIVYVTDTVKVIEEHVAINHYDFNVFDDENGRLDVAQSIQYNKLQDFNYTFTPMQKEITRTMERWFVPFVSVSYSTLNYVGAGGGVFIKDLGLEYNYLFNTFDKRTAHSFGVKYKF